MVIISIYKLPQSLGYFRIGNSSAIRGESAIHFIENSRKNVCNTAKLFHKLSTHRSGMVGWNVLLDFIDESYHFGLLPLPVISWNYPNELNVPPVIQICGIDTAVQVLIA